MSDKQVATASAKKSSRATSTAAGLEPATAHPTPRRWRGVSEPVNVWSGCMPNCSAPAAASAESGVAPLVWPTMRAEPATAPAAARICPSGTHSSATSARGGGSSRPRGPATS